MYRIKKIYKAAIGGVAGLSPLEGVASNAVRARGRLSPSFESFISLLNIFANRRNNI